MFFGPTRLMLAALIVGWSALVAFATGDATAANLEVFHADSLVYLFHIYLWMSHETPRIS